MLRHRGLRDTGKIGQCVDGLLAFAAQSLEDRADRRGALENGVGIGFHSTIITRWLWNCQRSAAILNLWVHALGRGTHSDPLGNDRDESECGEIVSGQAVVSCCQTSPVFETAEEALDEVTTSIDGAIERVRNSPRRGGWDDSLDATGFEPVTQAVRVISFICDQVFRRRDGTQQRHGHADVGNVAGRQREGDRPAAIIGQTMDFRGATAARAPDRLRPLPPFAPAAERCAFTCELSRLSSRGISPEAAICSNRRCQSPRCDHLL